jgi:cell division protein FtsQ
MKSRKLVAPSKKTRQNKRITKVGRRRKAGWLKILAPFVILIVTSAVIWGAIQQDVLGRALSGLDKGVIWLGRRLGLSLTKVEIEPMEYTSADEILKTSGVYRGQLMLRIDPEEVRLAIEKLPWVWSAIVQRRYPDKLYVRCIERQPIAIWNNGKKMVLVDKVGNVLSDHIPNVFSSLPVIAGEEAPEQAPLLFNLLSKFPDIQAQVKTAFLVGKRRWDLLFSHGTKVMLPEEDVEEALQRLSVLEEKNLLETYVIQKIDLRFKGKAVFKVTPEATVKLQTRGTSKET